MDKKGLSLSEVTKAIRTGRIFDVGQVYEIPHFLTGEFIKYVEIEVEHNGECKSLTIPYLDFRNPEWVIHEIRGCFKSDSRKADFDHFYNEMKSLGCLHNCGLED